MLSVPSRQVKLTWQERIYDAAFTNGSQSSTSGRDGVELCGDRFVSHVPPFQWQKLLAAVREENLEKQLATVPAVQVSWWCCSHVPQLCTLLHVRYCAYVQVFHAAQEAAAEHWGFVRTFTVRFVFFLTLLITVIIVHVLCYALVKHEFLGQ